MDQVGASARHLEIYFGQSPSMRSFKQASSLHPSKMVHSVVKVDQPSSAATVRLTRPPNQQPARPFGQFSHPRLRNNQRARLLGSQPAKNEANMQAATPSIALSVLSRHENRRFAGGWRIAGHTFVDDLVVAAAGIKSLDLIGFSQRVHPFGIENVP